MTTITSHDYHLETGLQRHQAASLDDAYGQAVRLLLAGEPLVDIMQMHHVPTCWDICGINIGRGEMLHRLHPSSHIVKPASGMGSTATFPPYVWRRLPEQQQHALESFTHQEIRIP